MNKSILMTGNKCLLDTSIIVQVFKENSIVKQRLDTMHKLFVSLTAVGELLFGAYKSERLTSHLQETENFLAACTILVPDYTTAGIYGKTKAVLAKKGTPIPDNYIWIAAIALQYQLPLYENDKHFHEVDGLQFFNPLTSV